MPAERSRLSENAMAILEMIAAGCSYEQILSAHPHLNYMDIFDSAREALDLSVTEADEVAGPAYNIAEIRTRHGRAYEPWTTDDETLLAQLVRQRFTVAQIANRLQRQRSAIRSRISKLNLVQHLSEREQARLHRISALDPKDPADNQDALE